MGTTPTTQSSLLVGTIHTSTSLSLKYKCLLVARHMWRMRGHNETPGYTTNARTQLLGANTKSSEHRSNKSESESSSSVAMSVHCWCSHLASVFAPCMLPLQFAAWPFLFQHHLFAVHCLPCRREYSVPYAVRSYSRETNVCHGDARVRNSGFACTGH